MNNPLSFMIILFLFLIIIVLLGLGIMLYLRLKGQIAAKDIEIKEIRQVHSDYLEKTSNYKDAVKRYLNLRESLIEISALEYSTDRANKLKQVFRDNRIWPKIYTDEKAAYKLLDKVFDEPDNLSGDSKDLNLIKLLQEQIENFEILVGSKDGPLSDSDKHMILSEFISLGMKLMDVVQHINNFNSVASQQGINVALLKRDITAQEAAMKAERVTNSHNTLRYAKNIQNCLKEIKIDQQSSLLILKGYKFNLK